MVALCMLDEMVRGVMDGDTVVNSLKFILYIITHQFSKPTQGLFN